MDFDWIDQHLNDDTTRLRLKFGAERALEILQIECRRKYAAKLRHTLADNPRFIFPTALSGEQSTSDILARYHAALIPPHSRIADLTAGLGIDAMAMAANAAQVTAIERDTVVAEALGHNSAGLPNFKVLCADCRDFIATATDRFDAVFIDPARRAANGSRTYALDQCEPDVVAMLPHLRRIADTLVIKASPMLDISHTLGLLPEACRAIVLGTTTECKELDIICRFGLNTYPEPTIQAVTLMPDSSAVEFSFTRSEEAAAHATFADPQPGQYLYAPYPAVMKSGAMKLLAQRFGLAKPHPNTHIWFGDNLVHDFPGHAYHIDEVQPYASRFIKRYAAAHPRVAVTVRNFDISADALRAKLRVADGPSRLFAITAQSGRLLATCSQILSV